MLENGTGADRQLAVFEKTKNLVDVAKYIKASIWWGCKAGVLYGFINDNRKSGVPYIQR
jgi:hypothetical protein